ncbi:MAG: hypothetical protein MJA27_01370 [Pseudanabaenales cyanobacterium]|nr:hypothetical protein [Pseudanabaenales cyanobacterium]
MFSEIPRVGFSSLKAFPGPKVLTGPWIFSWQVPIDQIHEIAKKFVLANAFNPEIARIQFDNGA